MYAFRCAMLHQFSDDTKNQNKKDRIGKFRLTVNNGHLNYNCDVTPEDIADGDILNIDISCFCKEVYESGEYWKKNNESLLCSKDTVNIMVF
jgi:hypothetical protein